MTWPKLILMLLQVTKSLLDLAQQKRWIKAGEDAEIARETVAILRKTEAAKQVMAEVMQMSDAQVDEALKKLEP